MSAEFLTLFRRSRFSTRLTGPNVSLEDEKQDMKQVEVKPLTYLRVAVFHLSRRPGSWRERLH
ncbi:MAG: hypothetical protein KGS61_20040 [Verrucomicrobia bacterium]|nr:hypothetical protein [Verrucomicrobiota bacterium]